MNIYQQNLVEYLRTLNTQDPPDPWRYVRSVSIGGLESIGYGSNSDLLLIVSSSGRSVIDCSTGKQLARDYTETEEDWEVANWYEPTKLLAEGIGPLAKEIVRLAGRGGGGLPTTSSDYWHLELVAPNWPNNFVLLNSPNVSAIQMRNPAAKIKIAPKHGLEDVILTFGFSPTNKTFVIAMAHGIDIFTRK